MSEIPSTDPVPVPRNTRGWFNKFLAAVEWLGNTLPNPVTLFALFALLVVFLSGVAGFFSLEVADPRPLPAGRAEDEHVIKAVSLMTADGFRWMLRSMVTNFTGFAPLGTVLVALLGVGVAEKSGLLGAAIRAMVLAAPKNLVTMVIVFAGVLSNTASEMGYVVLIPLGAAIFHALGRHPLAGLAAAYAGVSGGYSANLLIGTVDPLLSGITEEAARLIDPEYTVHAAVNWYFMIASTFLITGLGTWVTAKIVEPRLGRYDASRAEEDIDQNPRLDALSEREWKALKGAGLATLGVTLGLLYLCLPPSWRASFTPGLGVLRGPTDGGFSPLLSSVVPLIFAFFLLPGFVYGRIAGTMRTETDVIDGMAGAMKSMGLYIVLVFFAAQFVAYFNYTNLGAILAVLGADALRAMSLDNPGVFVFFIILCALVNLVMGSASAKWAVTAPVFVPMLMQIGYSPELTQTAYRIGDSTTNVVTPMMSYFGLILAFATKYDRKLGIGTLIATMLPYTICFLIGWTILFYLYVFVLGLPIGPDAPIVYPAPG
jgi:aminobenzoyl-glutamate transport protein